MVLDVADGLRGQGAILEFGDYHVLLAGDFREPILVGRPVVRVRVDRAVVQVALRLDYVHVAALAQHVVALRWRIVQSPLCLLKRRNSFLR